MIMKTRFAPSPTGYMHLGNARTALFNALLAKALKGHFLLRIEDTDVERSADIYQEGLLRDLAWLNISWDEGPFKQMDRLEVYQSYYEILLEKGLAYPCYCNETELSVMRKTQISAGISPRYAGTCRHLSEAQKQKKVAEGRVPCLRLRVPDEAHVRFDDLIYGMKDFKAVDLGDFVIQKQDGGPTFMFANAIDDALMGVTHALRGEDHLTNTPRQILLLQLLGLKPPQYGHFPIILGFDGKPLSKRNGSQSIQALREQGFKSEAVVNYMARLGHSYTEDAWMSMEMLGERFSLERIGRSCARYDESQLMHWQRQTLGKMTLDDLKAYLLPTLQVDNPIEKIEPLIQMIRDNITLPQDALAWSKQLHAVSYEWSVEAQDYLDKTPEEYWQLALLVLKEEGLDAKKITDRLKQKLNLQGKALFMPIRLALTGLMHGPQLMDLMQYLGQNLVEQKLSAMLMKE